MIKEDKRTIVLGASNNPQRYSYAAVARLKKKGFTAIPIGIKRGEVEGVKIVNDQAHFDNIHTISLYLSSENQIGYYDYILSLKPKRVIFNPGTYNMELIEKLELEGIEAVQACTLVMLSAGNY